MRGLLIFIVDTFDLNVLMLFFISGIFLAFDAKEYKKDGFTKEYKLTRFFGYFNIIVGMILYILTKNIRL